MDVLGSCKRTECVRMLGCKRGISGVRNLLAMADGGTGTCGAAARRHEGQRGKGGMGQWLTTGRLVLLERPGKYGFQQIDDDGLRCPWKKKSMEPALEGIRRGLDRRG